MEERDDEQHQSSELTSRGAAENHDPLTARESLLRQKLSRTTSADNSVGVGGVEQQDSSERRMTSSGASPHDGPRTLESTQAWGLADYGIPAPSKDILPDPAIVAKLRHFHALRTQGIHFNTTLKANKSFRNPAILQKLVDFVAVDEKKSAFPAEVWESSLGLGPDAWADALSEQQKRISEERDRAQQRGKRSNIDFAPPKSTTHQSATSTDFSHVSRNRGTSQDARRADRDYDRWDSNHSSSGRRRHRNRSRSPKER